MEEGEKTRHHSAFAACLAVFLIIGTLALIVTHFFGRLGPVGMGVVTSILAALFTAAALVLAGILEVTGIVAVCYAGTLVSPDGLTGMGE